MIKPKWEIVQSDVDDTNNIRILDGKFSGVIYKMAKLGFLPQEDESLILDIRYLILESAGHDESVLLSPEFQSIIEEICKEYLNIYK